MATIQFPNKGGGGLSKPPVAEVRTIDVIVDMANDVTMGTATDDIVVADLPKGTVVVTAGVEQVTAGTEGTGTLTARVGTTAMSGTLAHNATAGTVTAAAAADTRVVTDDATTLNVVGATAARVTGKIRVFAVVVEGLRPAIPVAAARDTSL